MMLDCVFRQPCNYSVTGVSKGRGPVIFRVKLTRNIGLLGLNDPEDETQRSSETAVTKYQLVVTNDIVQYPRRLKSSSKINCLQNTVFHTQLANG